MSVRLSRRGRWIVAALLIACIGATAAWYWLAPSDHIVRPRDDSARFREAEARLRAEPNVANIVYAAEQARWNVELPPGAEVAPGFAAYLCTVLAGMDMIDSRTSVRTVDSAKLADNGFDYAAATVEQARCKGVVDKLPTPAP